MQDLIRVRERLLPSLDALGDLPIERVIIPHGDLILSDGAARIRAAVAQAQPLLDLSCSADATTRRE
jgi:hypothetical protein